MKQYVVGNPVPTPEEMAKILGMNLDRVVAIRRIMSAPTPSNSSRAIFKKRRPPSVAGTRNAKNL